MSLVRLAAVALLPISFQLASAQGIGHQTSVWLGKSVKIFGSHEFRNTIGFSYGLTRPERALHVRGTRTRSFYDAYFELNANYGDLEVPKPYESGALGGLYGVRWEVGHLYVESGIGLQFQSHISPDLPSFVNSTPTLGLGYISGSTLYGLRFKHISNANTHRKNAGQNQLLLMVVFQI